MNLNNLRNLHFCISFLKLCNISNLAQGVTGSREKSSKTTNTPIPPHAPARSTSPAQTSPTTTMPAIQTAPAQTQKETRSYFPSSGHQDHPHHRHTHRQAHPDKAGESDKHTKQKGEAPATFTNFFPTTRKGIN